MITRKCRIGTYDGLQVKLVIHSTLSDLREWAEDLTAFAITHVRTIGQPAASVHLAADRLELTYIAHEMVHVAHVLRRRGCMTWAANAGNDDEEGIAYPVGDLTSAMYRKLIKLGYKVNV